MPTKTKTTPAPTTTEMEPQETVEKTPAFKPVKGEEIDWQPSETVEGGVSAVVRGYELSVYEETATTEEDEEKKTGRWIWLVKATSEVSETPELIGMDDCASLIGGQRWARQTLNRYLRPAKATA